MITSFDEARRDRVEWEPAAAAWWTDLGRAAGSVDVGLRLMDVDRGKLSVPLHIHSREEEIVFVLGGAGHVGRFWFGMTWDDPPKEDVTEAPRLDETRPENIIRLADAEADYEGEAGKWVRLARQAGAVRTGLNWGRLEPGRAGAAPHCHSADEELFVILDGGGTLELWPSPVHAKTKERETHEIRGGHVISRPPSTGISHFFRSGPAGMAFLAYRTRRANDVCSWPHCSAGAARLRRRRARGLTPHPANAAGPVPSQWLSPPKKA